MKKHILTIVVALGLTASISAQDSYYYCSGDKVLLTEHSTKVVAGSQGKQFLFAIIKWSNLNRHHIGQQQPHNRI